jgi:hypothetical protein
MGGCACVRLRCVCENGSIEALDAALPVFGDGSLLAADGTLYVGGENALLALHPDGTLKWNLYVYSPNSAATMAPDGTIYFSCGYFWLCAVEDSGWTLMQGSWPKQFHDVARAIASIAGLEAASIGVGLAP